MTTLLTTAALVTAGMIAAAVVLVLVARSAERKRIAHIEQWARENDWYVVRRPSVGWCARVPGRNRRGATLQVLGSSHGYLVSVTEYHYTTSSSSGGSTSTTTHHYLVTAVRLAAAHPPVAVAPRGPVSRLGRALFGERPTAIGHPDFDRSFRLRTHHPDLGRVLLGPALVTEHLAGTVPFWDLADHELITWQRGRITDPHRIPDHAVALIRVAMLLGR
jgi:hypothetical protein